MTLFDRYLVVDWSAASRPVTGANSIWVAEAVGGSPVELSNPATRAAAAGRIEAAVHAAGHERLLIAVDVSLGYPAGTSARFGFPGIPWRAMWDAITGLIDDDETNRNNRFEVAARLNERSPGAGPFWGCPAGSASPTLTTTRPLAGDVDPFRHAERRLHSAGRHPKSIWQLAYAGSVGSQTLTAIPVLERLRRSYPERVAVWPFDGGATPPPTGRGSVVIAEVYPSMFTVDVPPTQVLDAAQVAVVARELAAADADGRLCTWFAPSLTGDVREAVETEEGWVLGPTEARRVR